MFVFFFFFKQKTAYEMRISDWSSDVCSSDLAVGRRPAFAPAFLEVLGVQRKYACEREQQRDPSHRRHLPVVCGWDKDGAYRRTMESAEAAVPCRGNARDRVGISPPVGCIQPACGSHSSTQCCACSSASGLASPGCSAPSTSSRGGAPCPASGRTWRR